jgi:hypothetical protein
MKKLALFSGFLIAIMNCFSQSIDIDYSQKDIKSRYDTVALQSGNGEDSLVIYDNMPTKRIQSFNKGYLDFFLDGSLQSSVDLLRFNIGEPDGFHLPIYIVVGSPTGTVKEDTVNLKTISSLLNPVGGYVTGRFDFSSKLLKPSAKRKLTSLDFDISGGYKVLSSNDTLTGVPDFSAAGNLQAGLFFQTGAWPQDDPKNLGVAWINAKINASFLGNANKVFGPQVKDYFIGYAVDAGIEINRFLNLKIGVYQFLNNQTIKELNKPVVKLSFDYNLK